MISAVSKPKAPQLPLVQAKPKKAEPQRPQTPDSVSLSKEWGKGLNSRAFAALGDSFGGEKRTTSIRDGVPVNGPVPPAVRHAVEDGRIDLNKIRPQDIQRMSPQQREAFFAQLRKSFVRVDEGQPSPLHAHLSRADEALTRRLSELDPSGKTVARIAAVDPKVITSRDLARQVGRNYGLVLKQRLALDRAKHGDKPKGRLSPESTQALAEVASRILRESPDQGKTIRNLLDRTQAALGEQDARTQGLGVGAVLAGLIKSAKNRAGLFSALRDLAGVLPGGPAVAAIAKVALSQISEALEGDENQRARQLEGRIRRALHDQRPRDEAQDAVEGIQQALNDNGFAS